MEEEFNRHVEMGRNLPKQAPDRMLIAYGYYKQATEGDNDYPRPDQNSDVVRTFMYDQWSRLKGMTKKEAQERYIQFIKELMIEIKEKAER